MRLRGYVTVAMLALGLARAKAEAASLVLVAAGRARARIVVPDNALPSVRYAADELRHHVRKATGVELEIVPEESAGRDLPHRVFLGTCRATRSAGIRFEEEPSPAEQYATHWRIRHVIRTVGADFFMADQCPRLDRVWPSSRRGSPRARLVLRAGVG